MNNRFRIDEDSRLLREMRKLSQTELECGSCHRQSLQISLDSE